MRPPRSDARRQISTSEGIASELELSSGGGAPIAGWVWHQRIRRAVVRSVPEAAWILQPIGVTG
jgi:hypothetical protein